MDFLDPEKQKQHTRRLAIGYALMGVMLLLATIILLYHAYGYGVDKEGHVIQSGFVFMSSQPGGASIYVDGKKYKSTTDARLNLPSGQYVIKLQRQGYRDWQRLVTVNGGVVERFDYPFLFPTSVSTTVVKQYETSPVFSTQSPDHRWLMIATPLPNTFDVYDLDAKQQIPQAITIPNDILAAGSTPTGWQLVEWAKDNRHIVLRRQYTANGQAGSEYILVDHETPEQSQNLSIAFGFTPTTIALRDKVYDKYFLYDQNSGQLFTASLKEPTPQVYLSNVLAFATTKDIVAYATATNAPEGKVLIQLKQGDRPAVTVRQVAANSTYLLAMESYSGDLYLAAGAASENRVFVFRDPIGQFKSSPTDPLVPVRILKVTTPTYVSFSTTGRIVMAENGDKFAAYDAETVRGYTYQLNAAMDPPQLHASWMDDSHFSYVSGGKVVVVDFDGMNLQTLSPAAANHEPFFARDYKHVYVLDAQNMLTATALLTPADL